MTLNGQVRSAAVVYDTLIQSISNVYDDVVNGFDGEIDSDIHPTEYELFNNPNRVVDGPW